MQLVRPTERLRDAFLAMLDEFQSVGESHFVQEPVLLEEGFDAYLRWLERGESEHTVPTGLVPWSAYWAVSDGGMMGVSSLRHTLSPWMAEFGGISATEFAPKRAVAAMA